MKKNLLCLTLAASLVLSTNPAFTVFADGEEPTVLSVSAGNTLPGKRALPLSLLLAAEDAKSAKIERTTFDFSDAVSIRRYTGEGASATIPENNVYGITSSVPTLYTDIYRYCEVVYYLQHGGFLRRGKAFRLYTRLYAGRRHQDQNAVEQRDDLCGGRALREQVDKRRF